MVVSFSLVLIPCDKLFPLTPYPFISWSEGEFKSPKRLCDFVNRNVRLNKGDLDRLELTGDGLGPGVGDWRGLDFFEPDIPRRTKNIVLSACEEPWLLLDAEGKCFPAESTR